MFGRQGRHQMRGSSLATFSQAQVALLQVIKLRQQSPPSRPAVHTSLHMQEQLAGTGAILCKPITMSDMRAQHLKRTARFSDGDAPLG